MSNSFRSISRFFIFIILKYIELCHDTVLSNSVKGQSKYTNQILVEFNTSFNKTFLNDPASTLLILCLVLT
jgi:hypothetical protein